MKKNEKKMLNTLSNQEVKNLYGGFASPSKDELESHGLWGKHIICW